MGAYLARRLLLMIPTFFGITVITFVIIQMTPGDPVAMQQGGEAEMAANSVVSQEMILEARKMYGLDKPLYEQYASWVWRVVQFDFGTSFTDRRPVLEKIAEALPITMLLNVIALTIIYIIAIPTGIWTALSPNSVRDRATALLLYVLYSMPSFWVAFLLLAFFAGGDYFDWFPLVGYMSDGAEHLPWYQRWMNVGWHLVLPVICMTYGGFAFLSRFGRTVTLEVIRQDYVRTARAKGLPEWKVILKHGVRNALIPFITLMGTLLPGLLGGSVIIEQIFAIPGMGRLGFAAVMARDYPMVMGIATISAFLTLISLMIADLLYVLVDPRISFASRRG